MSYQRAVFIMAVVLAVEAFLFCGVAFSETIIIPRSPAGSGYKVIETQPRGVLTDSKKAEYIWVRVRKSKAEIRYEKYTRKLEIQRLRRIRWMNRTRRYGYHGTSYEERMPPIRKWKWVRIKK